MYTFPSQTSEEKLAEYDTYLERWEMENKGNRVLSKGLTELENRSEAIDREAERVEQWGEMELIDNENL